MAKQHGVGPNSRANLRRPTQSRSRESTEALLEIGRRMIEERGVEECNMSDVASAAGSSIGSLYYRFGSKEQFVREVMQRQVDASVEQLARGLAEIDATATTPGEAIDAVVRFIVGQFRSNEGLLRAQLRRSMDAPQEWRPFQNAGRDICDGAIRVLDRFPDVHKDPEWQRHVRIAIQMVFGTLNNILINRPGPLELSDIALAPELSNAAIRYLQWDDKFRGNIVEAMDHESASRTAPRGNRKILVSRVRIAKSKSVS
jgi:AcrR family transcriptional regulator